MGRLPPIPLCFLQTNPIRWLAGWERATHCSTNSWFKPTGLRNLKKFSQAAELNPGTKITLRASGVTRSELSILITAASYVCIYWIGVRELTGLLPSYSDPYITRMSRRRFGPPQLVDLLPFDPRPESDKIKDGTDVEGVKYRFNYGRAECR